ncbi:MAG: Uma2 family endonuclease [Gemmataceae bacterium]|nr:Uma2 family endonuclease [Gemmataceae bacterium]
MILKRPNTFPDSDGEPMADSTLQAIWILILYGNLLALFRNRDDVFVAANNLWYPLEDTDLVKMAPDAYVVFGRPKGHRGSYKQWQEGGIPLTVVFEVFSPGNTWREMMDKRDFCEEHGAEEFYILDPQDNELVVYTRGPHGVALVRRYFKDSFVSPRLGIRFERREEGIAVFYPNGERFLSFEELKELQEQESARASAAEGRAEEAEGRAEEAEGRAEEAEGRAEEAEAGREEAENRLNLSKTRLARVIELGRKARQGTASPEELAELERLES